MNMVTLIHAFRDAVHDSASLAAWCATNYESAHDVYVGIDTRNPPAINKPLVHLFPISRTDGGNGEQCNIGVSCGIPDEDLLTTDKTRVIELEGISQLDDYRDRIKTIIETVTLDAGFFFGEIQTTYETGEFFPYFLAIMDIPVHYRIRRIRNKF